LRGFSRATAWRTWRSPLETGEWAALVHVNPGPEHDLTALERMWLTNQPEMRYDFRELLSHLIERHLALDPTPVFPEPFQTMGELDLVV